jgi:hypothetical protein
MADSRETIQMKDTVTLTVMSVLSALFFTLHLAGDIAQGIEQGDLQDLIGGVLISVVWLYGAIVLAGRRSGYVILFLGSVLGVGVPVLHMMGKGVGVSSGIVSGNGGFLYVWTLLALGVTAAFSMILLARVLWGLRRGR